MTKTVTCPICGKEFTTKSATKKYCSFACLETGRILNRYRWTEKNADHKREYMREYMRARRKKLKDESAK